MKSSATMPYAYSVMSNGPVSSIMPFGGDQRRAAEMRLNMYFRAPTTGGNKAEVGGHDEKARSYTSLKHNSARTSFSRASLYLDSLARLKKIGWRRPRFQWCTDLHLLKFTQKWLLSAVEFAVL